MRAGQSGAGGARAAETSRRKPACRCVSFFFLFAKRAARSSYAETIMPSTLIFLPCLSPLITRCSESVVLTPVAVSAARYTRRLFITPFNRRSSIVRQPPAVAFLLRFSCRHYCASCMSSTEIDEAECFSAVVESLRLDGVARHLRASPLR